MKILAILIVLAFSCKPAPRRVGVLNGIPNGVTAACGAMRDRQFHCIAAGRAYTCVDNNRGCDENESSVQCAPAIAVPQ